MRTVPEPDHPTEGLGRRVLSGIGVMTLGKIGIGILQFLTRVILARLLTPTGLGVFGILTYTVSLCTVITNAGTQNSHIHDQGKKLSTPGQHIGFSVLFSLSAGSIGILGFYLAYHLLLYDWYFSRYFDEKYPLVLVIFFVIPVSILWLHLSSILLGDKQFMMANVFVFLNALLLLIFLFGFGMLIIDPLDSAVISWIAATVVSTFLLLTYCVVRYRSALALQLLNLRHKLVYGGVAMISGLSETIALLAPVFIAGHFLETEAVGLLFLALSLARIVEQMAAVLNSVLFPFNSALNKDQAARLTSNAFRMFLFLGVLGTVICWPVAVYAIPIIFGEEYSRSAVLLVVMLPGIVALSLMRILHAFFLGQSRPRTTIKPYLAVMTLMIVLEILLTSRFDDIGAAFGITGAYLVGLAIIAVQYAAFSQVSWSSLYCLSRSDFAALRWRV